MQLQHLPEKKEQADAAKQNVNKVPQFPLLIYCHRNKKHMKLISYLDFVPRLELPRGHEQHVAPQKTKGWSELRKKRRGGD